MSPNEVFLASAPHKMVFISLLSLFALIYLIFIYTRVYPKKRISYPLILLGFSILPLISILRPGSYESGDLTLHTARLISFYKNLEEGNLVPRWAGDLNGSYGYALFSFIYPLPYYLSSFFHFLGFTFLDSVKAMLAFTFTASGFAMFFWLKKYVSPKNAFLGAILYLFAPYHLVDMHFRVDVGESLAFLFLPLTFWCLDQIREKSKFLWIFLGGLSIAGLIMSHPAISLLGFVLIIAYSLFIFFDSKKLFTILRIIFSIILGLSFSAFYWIPVISESKFTYGSVVKTQLVFQSFKELLFSPWRGGFLFQGPKGELSFAIGYAHLPAIIASAYLILKKRAGKQILFFLAVSVFSIFLTQSSSAVIWQNLKILQRMLLTYRVLVIAVFAASALAAFSSEMIKNKAIYYILLSVAVLTTLLNWGNRKNLQGVKDNEIVHMLPTISKEGECFWPAIYLASREPDFCRSKQAHSEIEAVNSKIQINSSLRKNVYHFYDINLERDSLIKENTDYFPGWRLFVNGKERIINFENKNFPGVISFPLTAGRSKIELIFTDTPVRKYAFVLSTSAFLASGVFLVMSRRSLAGRRRKD